MKEKNYIAKVGDTINVILKNGKTERGVVQGLEPLEIGTTSWSTIQFRNNEIDKIINGDEQLRY
jgi:hypothetical protein